MIPQIEDNADELVAQLEELNAHLSGGRSGSGGTGTTNRTTIEETINIEGQGVGTRVGVIEPDDLLILETADLDTANSEGVITLEPGETARLIDYNRSAHALLAIGATERAGVTYSVQLNSDRTMGGTTSSPLGTINSPFSFIESLGGAPHANRTELVVKLAEDATSSRELAARAFLEVL